MTDESEQRSRAGFAEGNADIWQEFIGREIPLLYGMFMKRWPNPSLAEELVQKTVFDAVRGCASYDPSRGSPEEWIFGIARNNIRLEMRKRAGRPSVNGDINRYLEVIDTRPLPNEVLEREETVEVVRSALSRLESKEQREFLTILSANKVRFTLYILFQIVIAIAIGAILMMAACITCCCAACIFVIPYIGTVLILPLPVFKRAYSLFYLRQFGPGFDVFSL